MIHRNTLIGFRNLFGQEARLIYLFEHSQPHETGNLNRIKPPGGMSIDEWSANKTIRSLTDELRLLRLNAPQRIREAQAQARRHAEMASRLIDANCTLALSAVETMTRFINDPNLQLNDFERMVMGNTQRDSAPKRGREETAPKSGTAPFTQMGGIFGGFLSFFGRFMGKQKEKKE